MAQVESPWPRGDGEMAGCIRAFDWAATPLGPIAGWPQSLRTIVDLMLGSPSMMSLVCGEAAIHLYNDGFTALLREHRTLALGRSAFETFAQSRDVFEADVAAGMAGRSARLVAQRYPVLRHGRLEEAWFDVDYAPIRDEAGAVAGVLWTLKETTAQHLAEQALRTSEARHRLLIESWAQAEWETDPEGVVVADSPTWRDYTGQTLAELLGYGWLDAIHPDDRTFAERQWRETILARGLVDAEFRLRAPGGGWRWTNVRAAPVLDAKGSIEKWAGMNIDIDARKRAEARLRDTEERLRQFGEASSDVLWIRDAETLQWVYLTPAFERIYGLDRATALAGDNMTGWLDLIVPEDRPHAVAAIERVRTGERVAFEYRVRRPSDGTVHWLRNTDFPMRDAAGRLCWIGGVGRDVTAEKASARRLEVLVNELQHRSRNLLGVVTAMANRTVGRGSSAESFLVRLKALGRAQALLSQGGSDTVGVEALVRAELAAHANDDRLVIDGPAVTLTSQQVQNFALALHELATNAVKYGALKDETGRLSVTWELIRTEDGPHLALNWVETGVDVPPEAVTRRGYGRELIEQALAYALGGRTDYVLGEGGVRCRIELPIA